MNKILILILIAGIISVGNLACKKEAEEAKNEVVDNLIGSMKATVGAEAWQAQGPIARIQSGNLIISGFRLIGENKQSIALTIFGNTGTGTFDLNKNPLAGAISLHTAIYSPNLDSVESNPLVNYTATSGQIDVSSVANNKVSGTFNFKCINTAMDTIHITAGEFSNVNISQ